jgi:hypothetical protein
MPVHKFGTKPESLIRPSQPSTVRWMPKEVKYMPVKRSPITWEIFAQEQLVIAPGEAKSVALKFRVQMTAGVILVSLKQALKQKKCSIRNETVLEDVDDILIVLQNHSDKTVTIDEGSSLCFVAIN